MSGQVAAGAAAASFQPKDNTNKKVSFSTADQEQPQPQQQQQKQQHGRPLKRTGPFLTTSDVIRHLNQSLQDVNQMDLGYDPSSAEEGVAGGEEEEFLDGDEEFLDDDNNDETDDAHATTTNQQSPTPHFELQRRLPDGSTRRATTAEQNAADLESKLGQVAADIIGKLTLPEQWEFVTQGQLPYGNQLYTQDQNYAQAIDVYLTCIMIVQNIKLKLQKRQGETKKEHGMEMNGPQEETANQDDSKNIDKSNTATTTTTTTTTKNDSADDWTLPPLELELVFVRIMNNLAQAALKSAWYQKAIQFCNLALEQQQQEGEAALLGNNETDGATTVTLVSYQFQWAKLYFKRAKARRLKGFYRKAAQDLEPATTWLERVESGLGTLMAADPKNDNDNTNEQQQQQQLSTLSTQVPTARKEIQKEQQLIQRAKTEARKNQQRQERALRQELGGANTTTTATTHDATATTTTTSAAASQQGSSNAKNDTANDETTTSSTNLRQRRTHSSLRAPPPEKEYQEYLAHSSSSSQRKTTVVQLPPQMNTSHDDDDERPRLTYWQYYWAVVGRVAEELLVWMGDEETILKQEQKRQTQRQRLDNKDYGY